MRGDISALASDIPIGRERAITREALARKWGLNDRTTREVIARLRAEKADTPYAILSTTHSPKGYWRSDKAEEIEGFIRETEARAKNTFAALRGAKRLLRRIEREGQMTMLEEENAHEKV